VIVEVAINPRTRIPATQMKLVSFLITMKAITSRINIKYTQCSVVSVIPIEPPPYIRM
jgi:hypothetical protein